MRVTAHSLGNLGPQGSGLWRYQDGLLHILTHLVLYNPQTCAPAHHHSSGVRDADNKLVYHQLYRSASYKRPSSI